jgi:hypothetical protein
VNPVVDPLTPCGAAADDRVFMGRDRGPCVMHVCHFHGSTSYPGHVVHQCACGALWRYVQGTVQGTHPRRAE